MGRGGEAAWDNLMLGDAAGRRAARAGDDDAAADRADAPVDRLARGRR